MTDIRKGNLVRDGLIHETALYLGSGDFGGCFDATGAQPYAYRSRSDGETCFMHADFYHHGDFGLDYHMPVGRLIYEGLNPDEIRSAHQEQDIYDGTLATILDCAHCRIKLVGWFHPEKRDQFALRAVIEAKDAAPLPGFAFVIDPEIHSHYNMRVRARLVARAQNRNDKLEMQAEAGNARASVAVRVLPVSGRTAVYFEDERARISFAEGGADALILVSVSGIGNAPRALAVMDAVSDADAYAAESRDAWHRRWGDRVPDLDGKPWNALFLRSIHAVLASFGASEGAIAPPNGWSGSGWPFHFPGDFGFLHPLLVELGYYDIVKAKAAIYRRRLKDMIALTQRIFHIGGVSWPHVFPIGNNMDILPDGVVPNRFYYTFYSSVFTAKAVYDAAGALGDPAWTRETAWPIVLETARFFANALKKEDDAWSLQLTPSMSGDEFGDENAKNYLCTLYAARHSLAMAVDMAENDGVCSDAEEIGLWKRILRENLAFSRLENRACSVYQTAEFDPGAENRYRLGVQKHPVQLLPYSFLPWPEKNEWEKAAYEKRYQLCLHSDVNRFYGWTLAMILLTEAENGDREAFGRSFERLIPSAYADAELAQIYETSGHRDAGGQWNASPYYVTSMGIFALAAIKEAKRK